ncbi:mitochondrial uncoupling protein 2-like isoform X1 [Xyrichtys novacula]|nr:mitochondrial uncoupling protein 2-like isoform X1 [Xyrichtys novacula]
MAVAFAQPTDVVKVRFQAQARSPGHAKRYCSTIDAYKTIAKEEGVHGLWKGTSSFTGLLRCQSKSFFKQLFSCAYLSLSPAGTAPNIARNAIVNCTELVTYDFIKDTLLKSTPLTGKTMAFSKVHRYDSLACCFLCGAVTHGLSSTDNLPCHFISAFGAGLCTTVIASPVDVVKTRYMNAALGQYRSVLNCAAAMMTKEGPLAFYKGFMPSFLRLGSWNVVMFVTYEQLKRAMMAGNHNCTNIL